MHFTKTAPRVHHIVFEISKTSNVHCSLISWPSYIKFMALVWSFRLFLTCQFSYSLIHDMPTNTSFNGEPYLVSGIYWQDRKLIMMRTWLKMLKLFSGGIRVVLFIMFTGRPMLWISWPRKGFLPPRYLWELFL